MGPITSQLHKQITGWRVYSVVAPALFCAVAAFLYLHYGTDFALIFYTGLIVLSLTCISWWHWSLSTMVTMLAIMKDTDDHFSQVSDKLDSLQNSIEKPKLKLVKPIDESK